MQTVRGGGVLWQQTSCLQASSCCLDAGQYLSLSLAVVLVLLTRCTVPQVSSAAGSSRINPPAPPSWPPALNKTCCRMPERRVQPAGKHPGG
ncbi:hypothetical protein PBY51_005609 [Eleginops maclovinus]|uniref:Uncharacterized protein n=1 Tax=Eleginops maclovinus TaxID=56733 RepID=A0AAN7X5W2_ELEMC|nr:hypothetical protein PBY51_005609 [Eleginops maclovinus]